MEVNKSYNLFITHVDKEGPFLKILGQTDKPTSATVETVLNNVRPQFDTGLYSIPLENIHPGILVCAKYTDEKYYRTRVVNLCNNGFVEVYFFDYGYKDFVQFSNLRHMQLFPPNFISIPPLAHATILAEVHSHGGGEWNEAIFDKITKELKYREVVCTCIAHAAQYPLVKLSYGVNDLRLGLQPLIQPIPLQAQQAVILSMSLRMHPPLPSHSASTPAELNTYKAIHLEAGRVYPVYVSYVNDGPCHFSVQLESSLDCLGKLMTEINSTNLRPLDEVPIPGTICLARCEDDGNICRAVVTNEVDNQFKVFYVDFGNYEVVPLSDLYQIPFKYVLPKVMAIRYSLAGVEKPLVTLEMQCAFKKFVDDRLLHMKVLPTPTRLAIPKCELLDAKTGISALDIINRAATNIYPEPMVLTKGCSEQVKVSYVYSCNRFYVQLCSKENELMQLMLDLQQSCLAGDLMPTSFTVGLPCCALYQEDLQWYRSQIIEILPDDNVKVRYVDYGNEEIVPKTLIKLIEEDKLTVLTPQAIECCLNGYQKMEPDSQRDTILDELILENRFTMKVVEMLSKKALVELIDEANYNVASLLLDKIASLNSQVSPMLVQANNRIEHRKSNPPAFNRDNRDRDNRDFRQDRKPGRDNRNFNDRPNDKPWRQEDNFARNNDRSPNDNSEEKSWREQNRGFNSRNNDRNDSHNERFNNKGNNRNRDWGDRSGSSFTNDSWEQSGNQNANMLSPESDTGYRSRDTSSTFRSGTNGPRERNDWNSNRGKPGGFNKKDFRREGSEASSSGSERSFPKGPRTSTRNDKFNKKFGSPKSFSPNRDDSWNVSSIDSAPNDAKYKTLNVINTEAKVTISWFHNPGHFYCQLKDQQDSFKKLMEDIQVTYKGRKPGSSQVGAPVIGLFLEDKVLYRAQILEVLGRKYKVYYVDFGNVSVIDSVWPIETKFMDLPAQAICCEMGGIIPSEGSWQGPDNYGKYYDNEEFDCFFLSDLNEKFQVALQCNGQNIAEQLVGDGLAVYAATEEFKIDIPMLLGQQFRAELKSVNNLNDMIVALQCGVALNCKAHHLETATETFENTLREYLGKVLIIYVDNVIDDILEVTFYDLEGTKLVILEPDEGAYDVIDKLCPYPVFNPILYGYVSHVQPTSIFVQPKELADTICYFLEQLFEHYNETTQESPIIPEEGGLYVVSSADGNWYRGRAISFDDEKVEIQFVDYGNSESVDFSALREITPAFLECPEQCLEITVNVPTDTLLEKDVVANIHFESTGWEGEVQILGQEQELPPIENLQIETSADVSVSATDDLLAEQAQAVPNNAPGDEVPSSLGTSVNVSHIDSPTDFYLQLTDALPSIDELQQQLQEAAVDMPKLETPTAGVYCAAPYSVDQLFYRAQVLDADADITTVRFIDFGNTDVIDNNTTEIKTLPQNLLTLEVYATRCSLQIKPTEEEWSTAAHDRFAELVESDITVEFIDQDEKTNYVELYSAGNKITDILINENLALPNEFVMDSKSTCFVSHVNSPSEFWIQLENCADELESIAEQLSAAESFAELEDLTPGTLCVALFADDEMWYRARIISNTVAGIELLFIDYGNSCLSCNLRQIPEELVVTSPLAQKCSLQKPNGITEWSQENIEKFNEIAADGQTIFTVQKISTGETSVVQLFVDGVDILDILIPATEEGILRNVNSSENFQIEKAGEVMAGTYILKNRSEEAWNEEAESHFQSVSNQGTPFQIQFLQDNTVRLFENGKDIFSCLKDNKVKSKQVEAEASSESVDDNQKSDSPKKVTEESKIESSDEVRDSSNALVEPEVTENTEENIQDSDESRNSSKALIEAETIQDVDDLQESDESRNSSNTVIEAEIYQTSKETENPANGDGNKEEFEDNATTNESEQASHKNCEADKADLVPENNVDNEDDGDLVNKSPGKENGPKLHSPEKVEETKSVTPTPTDDIVDDCKHIEDPSTKCETAEESQNETIKPSTESENIAKDMCDKILTDCEKTISINVLAENETVKQ